MKTLLLILLLPAAAFAQCTGSPCQVGAGQTYTTIGACLSAANAGQTCNVHAGTYTENPSIPAGTVGNYITLQANGSDTVTINGAVTLHSHTKGVGNCTAFAGTVTTASCGFFVTNASSPTTACVSVASGSTDYFWQGNQCYDTAGVSEPSSTAPTFGYYLNDNFSYNCGPVASPNTCSPLILNGDHKIIEQVDASHFNNGGKVSGLHLVFRNNLFHDAHTNETGSNSGGDNHLDMIELSCCTTTQFVLFESMQEQNCFVDGAGGVGGSPACHGGPLAQCQTGTTCGPTILRFQVDYHIQGSATTADQGGGGGAWPNLKEYNNTWVDMLNGISTGIVNNQQNETSGANLNELYYFVTNPSGSNPYYYDGTPGSSNYGYAMAWCPNESSSSCSSGLLNHNSSAFTTETGNTVSNPNFVNATSDFHLQAGSPALNAGTNLTTTSGSGSSSTTLILNDVNYFQDGWGLPAGSGLGQMMPDCISVTTAGNHVCITAGGINYATNTITLASAISWSNGDKVWLYSDSTGTVRLTGSAPNIGALGTEGVAPSVPAPPIVGYIVRRKHEMEAGVRDIFALLDPAMSRFGADDARN